MKIFRWSSFAVASLSALAFTFVGADSASAGLFNHGSSGGSHGSSGGSHSSSGSSHGSSGGSHGSSGGSHGSSGGSHKRSHGGLFHRRSHGSSGGSHGSSGGSHGSSGGSYGSYGSSGGSWGSQGSSGGYYVASNAGATTAAAETRVGYLNVTVPTDAKVYLQDQLMTLTGTQRRFVTPELRDGEEHIYTVKVEVEQNGQTISKVTKAAVAAGEEVDVAVTFDEQNKDLVASVSPAASR